MVLPPNSTYLTQPMDLGLFAPLKRAINEALCTYIITNTSVDIEKKDLLGIIGQAFVASMTEANIRSSFRKAGLFPFDPSQVTVPGLVLNYYLHL